MEIKLTFQELSTMVTYTSHHYTTIHGQKGHITFSPLFVLILQTCVILYIKGGRYDDYNNTILCT